VMEGNQTGSWPSDQEVIQCSLGLSAANSNVKQDVVIEIDDGQDQGVQTGSKDEAEVLPKPPKGLKILSPSELNKKRPVDEENEHEPLKKIQKETRHKELYDPRAEAIKPKKVRSEDEAKSRPVQITPPEPKSNKSTTLIVPDKAATSTPTEKRSTDSDEVSLVFSPIPSRNILFSTHRNKQSSSIPQKRSITKKPSSKKPSSRAEPIPPEPSPALHSSPAKKSKRSFTKKPSSRADPSPPQSFPASHSSPKISHTDPDVNEVEVIESRKSKGWVLEYSKCYNNPGATPPPSKEECVVDFNKSYKNQEVTQAVPTVLKAEDDAEIGDGKQNHDGGVVDVILCGICKKPFSKNAGALVSHAEFHGSEYGEGGRKGSRKCSQCDKFSGSRTQLLMHMRSVHTGEALFQCSFCPQVFSTCAYKNIHEKNIHNNKNKN